MDGIGPIDPALARDLAAAAARNPTTTWCVTVTDQDGHAIGHGRARPEPTSHRERAGPGPPRQERDWEPGQARVLLHRHQRARAAGRLRHLATADRGQRTTRPAGHARPDHHPGLRSPVRSQRPRSGGQAAAPVPGPARHLHRAGLPAPPATSSTTPRTKRGPDLSVKRRPTVQTVTTHIKCLPASGTGLVHPSTAVPGVDMAERCVWAYGSGGPAQFVLDCTADPRR